MGIISAANRTFTHEVPNMSAPQRAGFIGAAALSLIRPISAVADLQKPADRERNWADTAKDTAISLSDAVDGAVARKTGGTSELGGWMDALVGDKVYMALKEADMVRRGRLSKTDATLRVSRDVAVTVARDRVAEATNGEVDVKARIAGKVSTFVRMGTNVLLDSPLSERIPNKVNRGLAHCATLLLVYSGAQNIHDYTKEMRHWQASADNSSDSEIEKQD